MLPLKHLASKDDVTILEHASVTCNMTGGLMDALACEFGCGMKVVRVEWGEKFLRN